MVKIKLEKELFMPGEEVKGEVILDDRKNLRGIRLTAAGLEETEIVTYVSTGKTTVPIYHNEENYLFDLKLPANKTSNRIPFSFTLPEKLLPSYQGEYADIILCFGRHRQALEK